MKRFNGKKFSHGSTKVAVPKCPICQTNMRMFLGMVRCTHMVKGNGGDRRVIKHGSLQTIAKRLKQAEAVHAQ